MDEDLIFGFHRPRTIRRVLLLVRYVMADEDTVAQGLMTRDITIDETVGYHVPAVRHRDKVYAKLEEDRLKGMEEDPMIGPPSSD